MFDSAACSSASPGEMPGGAAAGGRGRFEPDPEGARAFRAAHEAEIEACWARLVAAEQARWDATREVLLDAGVDPADGFVVDAWAEVWAADEAALLSLPGFVVGVDEAMPADAPGWVAANVGLLDELPGDAESTVAEMVPGVELARVLDESSESQLSAGELGDAVAGWERLIAWAQARQASALAELTHRDEMRAENPQGYASLHPVPVAAGELAVVWPWTKPQAERMVAHGVELVEDFPAIHEAWTAGRLDQRRVTILLTALRDREPEVVRKVEAAVLPHVHKWTSVKLSQVVNRLLHQLDPRTSKKNRREARKQRRVWTEPAKDGMAWLYAYLPAEDAQAIMSALNAGADTLRRHDDQRAAAQTGDERDRAARRTEDKGESERGNDGDGGDSDSGGDGGDGGDGPGRRRTLDQARADALAGLAWSSLYTGTLGGDGCTQCGATAGVPLAGAHGRPITVNLTLPLTTWLGLDEHPAHLDGYGPIDADTARVLAAAGVWRWVVTDPVGGHALDYGRTRYTPPQELVDFILLRDRECIMPGCHRPAYRCQIDHRNPYPQGPTSACNCSLLCTTCHLQKHHAGWTIERIAPGVQRFTSPTGRQHTVKLPGLAPPAPEPDPPPTDTPPEPDDPP
ncbi:HNH endonuclease signature motif containing protein, partial [Phytoactinopolyspora halotolerans]